MKNMARNAERERMHEVTITITVRVGGFAAGKGTVAAVVASKRPEIAGDIERRIHSVGLACGSPVMVVTPVADDDAP